MTGPSPEPVDVPAAALGEARDGRGHWQRWAVLGTFAAGLALFFALGGHEWLRFETLREHRDQLLAVTREQGVLALLLAFLAYVVVVALSVPGGAVASLAMGFLFGRWVGTLLIVGAATLGATLVFLAARHLFADAARRRLGPRAQRVVDGFEEDAVSYLLFLRLVPVFPFWLANLIPAFTPVSTRVFVLTTAAGIVPGSFVFSNLGESLGRIESPDQLLSPRVLVSLGLLGLLALLPVAVRKLRTPEPGDVP
ncbi:MAG TPA: TVP38/TMEM64 family protein [Longimicrobiaceae bacterium]|nr:TVP38/TMEM64 family protein [Longimicrobiaceae bacterium]